MTFFPPDPLITNVLTWELNRYRRRRTMDDDDDDDDDDDGRHTLNLFFYEVHIFSVTNKNFDENSHRQTKSKIPKSSLAYITYMQRNKKN